VHSGNRIEEMNNEELGRLLTLSNIVGVINSELFKTTWAVKKCLKF